MIFILLFYMHLTFKCSQPQQPQLSRNNGAIRRLSQVAFANSLQFLERDSVWNSGNDSRRKVAARYSRKASLCILIRSSFFEPRHGVVPFGLVSALQGKVYETSSDATSRILEDVQVCRQIFWERRK